MVLVDAVPGKKIDSLFNFEDCLCKERSDTLMVVFFKMLSDSFIQRDPIT